MVTVAILGGGNGGFAAAAHLESEGHRPHLYNRSPETVEAVREAGGVEYSGTLGEGFAPVPVVTTDLETALSGADLVMTCLPAVAFEGLARKLAPLLDGTTPVLLNPGSTGGTLAMRQALREAGAPAVPTLAETNTLTYICRKQDDDHIHVASLVDNVRCGTLKATARGDVIPIIQELYPTLRPVPNVLHTSLSNVNAVLHPPGIVLSAAWIEHTGGDFRFYYDAGTPAVASLMADLDEERLAIADAWGLDVDPFPRLFADLGSTTEAAGESGSFYRVLRESEPNKSIKAPSSVDHRYFNEDIPFGVVPMKTLAALAGIDTPVLDSLVTIACSITGTDYQEIGWTRDRLGLPAEKAAAKREL